MDTIQDETDEQEISREHFNDYRQAEERLSLDRMYEQSD